MGSQTPDAYGNHDKRCVWYLGQTRRENIEGKVQAMSVGWREEDGLGSRRI